MGLCVWVRTCTQERADCGGRQQSWTGLRAARACMRVHSSTRQQAGCPMVGALLPPTGGACAQAPTPRARAATPSRWRSSRTWHTWGERCRVGCWVWRVCEAAASWRNGGASGWRALLRPRACKQAGSCGPLEGNIAQRGERGARPSCALRPSLTRELGMDLYAFSERSQSAPTCRWVFSCITPHHQSSPPKGPLCLPTARPWAWPTASSRAW